MDILSVNAFHEKAGRSQVDSVFALWNIRFSRRVATVAMLPSALSMSDLRSLGASWVFSFQPCQTTISGDIDTTIKDLIADLDALISRQLNEIMHSEPLQKLEATWRGLHYLLQQTESYPMLKIKLINLSKTELIEEFEKVAQFDKRPPFKRIYEEAFGTVGSEPFAALLGDYEFGRNPQDLVGADV
jgi:type VI secretion system ImpC/EvpB family protein